MSHTAFIYGRIEGPYKDLEASQRNADLLRTLSEQPEAEDEWPWLDQTMFSIPSRYHIGAVRSQLIHFGVCFKEDLSDDQPRWFADWLAKFELILVRFAWHSAVVHLERDTGLLVTARFKNKDSGISRTITRDQLSDASRVKTY